MKWSVSEESDTASVGRQVSTDVTAALRCQVHRYHETILRHFVIQQLKHTAWLTRQHSCHIYTVYTQCTHSVYNVQCTQLNSHFWITWVYFLPSSCTTDRHKQEFTSHHHLWNKPLIFLIPSIAWVHRTVSDIITCMKFRNFSAPCLSAIQF